MDVTIDDVARAAGVSTSTVSRALSGTGRISSETRSRVIRVAVELNYRHASALSEGRPRGVWTLAVVAPTVGSPFTPEILRGVTQAADAGGHLVVVTDSGSDQERAWASMAGLRRKKVGGIIIVESHCDSEQLRALTRGIPTVIFDRTYGLDAASTIAADQYGGARLATRHLIELGHTAITHLRGPEHQPVAAKRAEGYCATMLEAGLEPHVVPAGWLEDDGYRATMRLLADEDDRPMPTAIFAASDPCAIGTLAALDEQGISVPGQVSVVGFDDLQISAYTHPRLTTVRQPGVRLGAAAASILIRQFDAGTMLSPVHEVIPVDLIVRGSTAPRGA